MMIILVIIMMMIKKKRYGYGYDQQFSTLPSTMVDGGGEPHIWDQAVFNIRGCGR
jgi:hypothetical protein